jgi:arylsulfatase A-like enzyme
VPALAALPVEFAARRERGRAAGADSHGLRTRPNTLLLIQCSFRYDHLGAAGYERERMPFVDSLAARGIFFEHAEGGGTWTKPGTVSILTGLTAGVHQMNDFYTVADILGGTAPRKG